MVISALGLDITLNMHCPGHNTVWGSPLLASVGIFALNESRVKNNVPYLEGQFVGGGRLEGPLFIQYSWVGLY